MDDIYVRKDVFEARVKPTEKQVYENRKNIGEIYRLINSRFNRLYLLIICAAVGLAVNTWGRYQQTESEAKANKTVLADEITPESGKGYVQK